jgi:hypothetical protein
MRSLRPNQMKIALIIQVMWLAWWPSTVRGQLPAFPGAVGFGAVATGGRGGEIYRVNNLHDRGPGSFRDAVGQGHRVVVFDVGGYIELRSAVSVASDITILGQSAPGDGIATKNFEVSFSNSRNVIVRYIRFRQGLTPKQEKKYALGVSGAENMIFDHVSVEFGRWDCIGLSKSKDITFQYCIIGPGIGPQCFGCLCESDGVTFSHNLWISNKSRSPKSKGIVQYVNNVVYNWGVCGYVGGHSAAGHAADVVNNYFINGPNSNSRFAGEFRATDRIFQAGNLIDMNCDGKLNGVPAKAEDFGAGQNAPTFAPGSVMETRVPEKLDTAEAAYGKVVAGAGCSLHRDSVDTRLIADLRSLGTRGSIIHDPAEMGGFGEISGGSPPASSAHDGIPDAWKRAHGINLLDAAAAQGDYNHDGYMNVEKYLNDRVSSGR